ncbi:MAG: 4-hydroxy-tetrahydrodipicolinate synthase [Bdellovibrionales bacterium]
MSKNIKFSGVFTALVTPFKKGRVDYSSLKKLIRNQLDNNVNGFVVNGTTGESPTLSIDEVKTIFRFVKKQSDNAVPLILGTGSNATKETIFRTKLAQKLKADAALIVAPYYNKPTQTGLALHYKAIAKETRIPIILYNVPSRTVISISEDTILELSKIKNIVGIKEASGNLNVVQSLVKKVPKNFLLTSGDDSSCVDFVTAGGKGVISVVSHVIPKTLCEYLDRAARGENVSKDYHSKYDELNSLLGIETNPIPVKVMLYLMGIIDSPELRLPLCELSSANKIKVEAALKRIEIL